ncbi:MAG TPA: uroporphyrinogen-III synthase [Gemmatimonadaceae bacterium]|nr:uroporphyrinogen-III synthase [Gemmatimonadaceae bacterium]
MGAARFRAHRESHRGGRGRRRRTDRDHVHVGPDDLADEGIDAVLLASPTAAEGLVNRAIVGPDVDVITIGPTTSAAAAAVGLTVRAEARRPDLAGMLEAMP